MYVKQNVSDNFSYPHILHLRSGMERRTPIPSGRPRRIEYTRHAVPEPHSRDICLQTMPRQRHRWIRIR